MTDIIIINYFSLAKIKLLLAALYKEKKDAHGFNVIIVSNSSENEIADLLSHYSSVRIIQNEENIGFGRACNKALPYCNGEFILLLNPDTLVSKHVLEQCVDVMTKNKEITVLGVKHYDYYGNIVPSCSRFYTLKNHINHILGLTKLSPKLFKNSSVMHDFDYSKSAYVDQVMGAFMMVQKSFIDKFGFMDERYFMFGEDVDFCKKVWDNGGKVFYNADIQIIHEGGASTENINPQRLCYSFEGRLKYAYKHFSKTSYFVLLLLIIFVGPVTRLVSALFSLNWTLIKDTLKAYFLFYRRHQFK